MQKTKTISVISSGMSGSGITQLFAVKMLRTKVYDPMVESLETLYERISRNYSFSVIKLDKEDL